jgi:hypothetical protein
MLPQKIEALRAEFDGLAEATEALAAPLSDNHNWQPASDRCSIGQCLEHLNTTARAYLPALDDGISESIRKGAYRPL